MKKDRIKIQTERLTLTSLTRNDLDFTLNLRNIPSIRQWFSNSEEIQKANHYAWFESYLKKQDDYIFIVKLKDSTLPIGQVAIYNLEPGSKAEVGRFMCDPLWQGKGYIKEAILGLLYWAKKKFRTKFIYLYVIKNNINAIGLYKKIGFEEAKPLHHKSFSIPKNTNIDEIVMRLAYES